MPSDQFSGLNLNPFLRGALALVGELCRSDVIVERATDDTAVIRLAGLTNDFAYGTLKFGVDNPSIGVRALDRTQAGAYAAGGSPGSNILVFILYTAAHELIVLAGPASGLDLARAFNTVSVAEAHIGPPKGAVLSGSSNIGPPSGRIISGSSNIANPGRHIVAAGNGVAHPRGVVIAAHSDLKARYLHAMGHDSARSGAFAGARASAEGRV